MEKKNMLRFVKSAAALWAVASCTSSVLAFSLLGPVDGTWQVQRIGYDHVPPVYSDIGGPMNLGEEYRWNIRTITYGFDPTFVNYFGQRGMDEVRKAIAVFNALPPFSKMSADLSEFPMDTRRVNYEASSLLLWDMKSAVMSGILEQLGLATPERYAWTLSARLEFPTVVFYNVIMRNFDPVTWEPTKYVNGTLYTYGVYEIPNPPYDWADAVEIPVDPLSPIFTSVASGAGSPWGSFLVPGVFYSGLTRDDIGGLRYLYRPQNYNVEAPLAGTTLSSGGPLSPVDLLNTNNTVITAIRPGVDKITFVEGKFESTFGAFITITNRYVDYFVTNNTLQKIYTQRVLTNAPDMLFSATYAGATTYIRTDSTAWQNNEALNRSPITPANAGPGVITPSVNIIFGTQGPMFINDDSSALFLFESGASATPVWGAYDGTTNRPVAFPSGTSISDIERQVLGH
jgi:hypothetical protein